MTPPLLRPLTEDDIIDVCEVHRRSEAHDGVPRVLEVDELREELSSESLTFDTDTRLAVVDGTIAGYAYTLYMPGDEGAGRCYVMGAVAPERRGCGVGTALLEWGINRARAQLRSLRAGPGFIRVNSHERSVSAHRLYEKLGFEQARCTEELLRPLTDLPPLRSVPDVRIVAWPADRDEEIRVVKNTSFQDHWGSTPSSEEQWHKLVRGFGARPDLSFIALDSDDHVVAHCLNARFEADDQVSNRVDGWIDSLGTLSHWRGRGIASALIGHSLHAFANAGLSHASIAVDSESLTGAATLYRSLGFQLQHRSITYQIQV